MMRTKEQIESRIELVKQYWLKNSELRLGQLLTNASMGYNGNNDIFYLEDEILLQALKKMYK